MSFGPPGPMDQAPGGGGNGETPGKKLDKAKTRFNKAIRKGLKPGNAEYDKAKKNYEQAQRDAYDG